MDAKKARQAEVDDAQKKIAEIMVEAQAQVGRAWHFQPIHRKPPCVLQGFPVVVVPLGAVCAHNPYSVQHNCCVLGEAALMPLTHP